MPQENITDLEPFREVVTQDYELGRLGGIANYTDTIFAHYTVERRSYLTTSDESGLQGWRSRTKEQLVIESRKRHEHSRSPIDPLLPLEVTVTTEVGPGDDEPSVYRTVNNSTEVAQMQDLPDFSTWSSDLVHLLRRAEPVRRILDL